MHHQNAVLLHEKTNSLYSMLSFRYFLKYFGWYSIYSLLLIHLNID